MTDIDIRKDRFEAREETGGWGHSAGWYSQHKEISSVNIDTTRGEIDVYINGEPVASKPKPKRFVLPMPVGLEGESWRAMHIAIREKDEGWYGSAYHYDITASETPSYTQADIDAAPNWVRAITPVEVKG